MPPSKLPFSKSTWLVYHRKRVLYMENITWVWGIPYIEDEETGEMRIASNYELLEEEYYD